MKTKKILTTIVLALLAHAAFATNADISINGTLSIKPQNGDVSTAANPPVNEASVDLLISLYSTVTGGLALWQEAQAVPVKNGSFTITLSDVPDDIFLNNGSLFLGIAVEDDSEMSPRIPFNAVPYSISSKYAAVADALSPGAVIPPGPKGDTGPAGPQGSAGPQGPAGAAGPKGDVGAAGPQDPAGATGPKGDTGAVGAQGPSGPIGPMGPMGMVGPQGLQGLPGPMGPSGAQGEIGPAGPTGPAGPQGEIGPMGPIGPAGQSSFDLSYYRRAGTGAPEQWDSSPTAGSALTTGAPSANVLRAIPFIVSRETVLDRIAVAVTNAKNGSARLGIYEDNGNLYPGALMLDAGEISTTPTGTKILNINETLTGNKLYWLAVVGSNNPTMRCLNPAYTISLLGFPSSLSANPGLGYSVGFNYAALPQDFPGSAGIVNAAPVPAIFVRLAD